MEETIAKLKQAEKTIEFKLELEKTISSISSRLVGIYDIDDAITAMLGDIGKLSGASRAYLFLFNEDGTTMDNTHEWCAEGVSLQIDNLKNCPMDMAPWWMEKLRNNETIHITDVSKLPVEAQAEREILESQDIKSLLVLPLYIGGELNGFIGFDNVAETGRWTDNDVPLLRISSEILGNALERKQAEEALRKSKEFSENLIASMKDGFSALDRRGVHMNVNKALCQMTGFSREELVETGPPHLYWPEEEYENIGEAFQKTLRGEFEDFELTFKRKNGERFPVIVSPSQVTDEEGDVISYFATVKDITERKKMEEVLGESEEKYRNLVENMTDSVCIVDLKGRLLFANKAGEKLGGYTFKERKGQNLLKIIPKKYWPLCLKMIEKAVSGRPIPYFEIEIINKDGNRIPVETGGQLVRFKGKKAVQIVTRDITERKKAQETLRKTEEHFRRVIENIFKFVPEGLLVFTDKLSLFKKNKAFQDIVQKYSAKLNYTEQELAETIIEQARNKIVNGDHSEIRISKKQGGGT